MDTKTERLLRTLPVPFTALVDMTENPPHAIYITMSRMLDDPMNYNVATSAAIRYLQTGMVKPGDLIPLSQKAFSLFCTMIKTRPDPEQDEQVRTLAALTWQLVNNVLDLMENMIFAKRDMPLAGEIAVVLKIYPDPNISPTAKQSAS